MREDFLKKIGPFGMALILILSAVGTYLAFTIDLGVPQRYLSLHDTEYYSSSAGTMAELLEELRENVFPSLEGITEAYVLPGGKLIRIRVTAEQYGRVRAAILRDFDESLFEFESLG